MTTTIGTLTNVPAPGDPIKSDWPVSISTLIADLNTRSRPLTSTRTFSGNQDSVAGGTMTDWFTFSSGITIPAGTTKLTVLVTVSGFFSTADYVGSISVRIGAGAVAVQAATVGYAAASARQTVHFTAEIPTPATGAVIPTVATSRASGTGVLRVDASAQAHFVGLLG